MSRSDAGRLFHSSSVRTVKAHMVPEFSSCSHSGVSPDGSRSTMLHVGVCVAMY